MGIKEETILEVFQVGKCIVVTPEKMMVKELSDVVRKEMTNNDIDINELLAELREGSHDYETD